MLSKYLYRLFLIMVILGSLPVLVIGIFSYTLAAGDVEQKVQDGNAQLLNETQLRVDQVLKTLQLSAVQYVNSSLVTETMKQPLQSGDFEKIRNLTTGFNNLQTITSLDQMRLINFEHNWVVSGTSFSQVSDAEDQAVLRSYRHNRNSMFWVTDTSIANNGYTSNIDMMAENELTATSSAKKTKVVSMVFKIPLLPSTGEPRGLLVLDIANDEIDNWVTSSTRLGQIYVFDQYQQEFLDSGQNTQYPGLQNEVFNHVHQGQRQGFFNWKSEGKEVGVTYSSSTLNGWVYVSVVSIGQITSQTRKIAILTISVCVAMLLLTALLAFLSSRRMYSPVSKLMQLLGAGESADYTTGLKAEQPSTITGYLRVLLGKSKSATGYDKKSVKRRDEFAYIGEQVERMRLTGKELEEQIREQIPQLRELSVIKLISGQIPASEFERRRQIYGFPQPVHSMAVLVLQIDTVQGTRYEETDRELLLFAINNMVSELISVEHRFSPVLIEQSQVSILVEPVDNEDATSWYHAQAERVRTQIQDYLTLSVSIGISRPFEHYQGAPDAYGEGLEALKQRMSLGNKLIIHFEDIDHSTAMEVAVYTQLKQLEDRVIQSLQNGDYEQTPLYFDEYIRHVMDKEIHFRDYPVLLTQLAARVYEIVQQKGGTVNSVLGKKASLHKLLELQTVEEIRQWFTQSLFEPLQQFLQNQAESQYMNIADQMIQMIQQRYEQDLSLEMCAEQLNFHPVYLSRVFKKETGIKFSDYVAEYRMNQAKKWLETTDWRIADIAEKLSYSNTTAFIRIFRKIVGTTPGKYREEHRSRKLI